MAVPGREDAPRVVGGGRQQGVIGLGGRVQHLDVDTWTLDILWVLSCTLG